MKLLIFLMAAMMVSLTVTHAEPLPLVPQGSKVSATTVQQTETTKKQSDETKQTTKADTTDTATLSTEKKTTETKSETNVGATTNTPIEPRGSSSQADAVESTNNKWFISDKVDGYHIKSLAYSLEKTQDFRGKVKAGAHHLRAGLKKAGDFGADSLRAAADAVLGWRY